MVVDDDDDDDDDDDGGQKKKEKKIHILTYSSCPPSLPSSFSLPPLLALLGDAARRDVQVRLAGSHYGDLISPVA
jgi:hypothetical protein